MEFDLADIVKKKLEKISPILAEKFYELLIYNIENNTFGYVLSENTLKARRRRNVTSTTPLVDTREYLKAIIVEGTTVTVKNGMHTNSGLTYKELSFILEYGRKDKHIPAFAVWRKTYKEFEPIAKKLIKEGLK